VICHSPIDTCLRSILQLHLLKEEKAKIRCVDAHEDEHWREYGKFKQGATRQSLRSNQKRADASLCHKAHQINRHSFHKCDYVANRLRDPIITGVK
jgi:hypothetical protein